MTLNMVLQVELNLQFMGEGVSLSLPRYGFPVGLNIGVSVSFPRDHGFYVGSVPFSREQVYYGNSILPDFQAVNDTVISVSRLHVSFLGLAPYSREHVLFGEISLPGERDLPKKPGRPNQNLSSLSPQKRRTVYGCLFPSGFRRGAIASTDLLKMEVDLASIAAAGSDVPAITGKINSVGVVNPGVLDLDLSGSQTPDLSLDHQKYIRALPPTTLSGDTKLMPESQVPEPVLKSLPTPATGSLGLFSAGYPLSRGY